MKKNIKSLIKVVLVVLVTVVVFKFVVIPVRIEGNSMNDTLEDEDIALMQAIGVTESSIARFDIVVINSSELHEKIIKRVIGLPGETIEYKDDKLYVNGKYVAEDFLDQSFMEQQKKTYSSENFTKDFKVTLSKGQFFVLGDNRLNSTDSRALGAFTISDIVGKEGILIFPLNRMKLMD